MQTLKARAFALFLAALIGTVTLGCDRQQQSTQMQAPPPPQVTVAQPLKKLVASEDEHVGRFTAVDMVEVKARVSGYLEAIHFRDGQIVEKGAPLFTIDQRPFEIALEQAKSTLEQARSNLALAEADLARAKDLSVGSTISRAVLDQRVATRRAAEAAVMAQTAAVRQATLDLEFTSLKAPIAGRIGDRRVSTGNFVTAATTANATMLATIQSIDPIRFEFTLDEAAYLRFMRGRGGAQSTMEGAPVKLKLLDENDFVHTGRIDFIDNAFSRTSGTVRGRAELKNPDGLLLPGMFARVRIRVAEPAQALLVPDSAIGSEQVRKFVLVVGPDNVARPKYVRLGAIVDGLRVIEEGLSADDRVVINGLMRARPGSKVAPQNGTIAAVTPQAPATNAN